MPIIKKFTGINNVHAPESAGPSDLQTATNVVATNSGTLIRRPGSTIIHNSPSHSLFQNGDTLLFVDGDEIKTFNGTTVSTVTDGLTHGLRMHFTRLNGLVYYSNGIQKGVILEDGTTRSWGLEPPPKPELASRAGDMVNGIYQCFLTYVRSDGQESAPSEISSLEVTQGGLHVFSVRASDDPTVSGISVYLSASGGESSGGAGMYRLAIIENADTAFTMRGGVITGGALCATMNRAPVPASTISFFYRGRMYMVSNNVLWHSDKMNYELITTDYAHHSFQSDITMALPVENGIWIGTESEYMFLSGIDPLDDGGFVIKNRAYVGVKRCGVVVSGGKINRRKLSPGPVAIWVSALGVHYGDGNGVEENVTFDRWMPGTNDSDGGSVVNMCGFPQYIFGVKEDVLVPEYGVE